MPDTDDTHYLFEGRRSLKNQLWSLQPVSERLAAAHADAFGLPLAVARLLTARGVARDDIPAYLAPSLKDTLPDPSVCRDMDKAAERLANAVQNGESICIFGDYDVDGATSSAVLLRTLSALGVRAQSYIPDRLREGYGPSVAAMGQLADAGTDLVITVDCGTLSFEPLRAAADRGLSVIVIDHHKAETQLPVADAVVNPNRLDDDSGLGMLAAVGVAFLLAVALVRTLRQRGFFAGRGEPNLLSLLDLVALGTVADVVPLVGLNRVFVSQGLKVMAQRQNVGLAALADVAGISEKPSAYHLGFLLGPRVNAGGRVGEAGLGTALLTTDDPGHAARLAARLDGYNKDRRAIEAEVQEAATARAEHMLAADPDLPVLVVAADGWHPGVIGIVAGRLKEQFARPAIVISFDGDEGKGSARSITGVDMGAAVLEAAERNLLVKGGGHAMAAGMSLVPAQLQDFTDFMHAHLRASVDAARQHSDKTVDGLLSLGGASVEMVQQLESVGPFGMGNPAPRFAFADVKVIKADIVGGAHIRTIVQGRDGQSRKAMAFREADSPLGQHLTQNIGRDVHLIARVKIDNWGRTPKTELLIEDVIPA